MKNKIHDSAGFDDDEVAESNPPVESASGAIGETGLAEPREQLSMDRVLEKLSILPALNPRLFDSILKASSAQSSTLISEIVAKAGFGELGGVGGAFKSVNAIPDFAALTGVNELIARVSAQNFEAVTSGNDLLARLGAQHVRNLSGIDWSKLANISANTLSKGSYFKDKDEQNYAYSEEMTSPASYFERDEVVVDSFEALNYEIAKLIKLNPELPLVWRGQQNHEWGLHSGLYLALQKYNGVQLPSDNPKGEQSHPTETQMQDAEAKLITHARENWRLDGMPALELLARLQHYGAPTRLLDVTRNPYIAAWFAIESSAGTDDADARLFALATRPVPKKGQEALVAATDTSVRMSELPQSPMPFWHYWLPGKQRQEADWGTGSRRRVWIPPAYDQRIVSQNAAFVLDGVPIIAAKTAPYFKRGTASEYWNKADLLASSSIYAKTFKPGRRPQSNAPNFSPTFTYRITQAAKDEIREVLESRFSYSYSTIYPDISATGRFLKEHFNELIG